MIPDFITEQMNVRVVYVENKVVILWLYNGVLILVNVCMI